MCNTKIMVANNTQVFSENLETIFKLLNTAVYDNFGQRMVNFRKDNESANYGACTFEFNGAGIIHRIAKITPKKTGQFVAIWKRSQKGITMPFDVTDNFDFMVITTKCDHQLGQFIFPKEVLFNKGIISQDGKHGKRGIRVYPPWDKVTNKQAQVSQNWQLKYFLPIKNNETFDFNLAKQLYGI